MYKPIKIFIIMSANKKNEPTLMQVGVAFVIVALVYWMCWQILDALFFGFITPWARQYNWLMPVVQVVYVLVICCGIPVAVLAMRIIAMKMAENNEK